VALKKLERETRLARRVHPKIEVFYDTIDHYIQFKMNGKDWISFLQGEPFSMRKLQESFRQRFNTRKNVARARKEKERLHQTRKREVRDERRLMELEKGLKRQARIDNGEDPEKVYFC